MSDLFVTVAQALHAVLPGWVRLPSLTFELPHLIYWPVLILFPLIAFWLVRREARAAGNDRVTLPISYLLWASGGFVGLHRFYLRAAGLGVAYIALFLLVLLGNRRGADARNIKSEAANDLRGADFQVEHFSNLLQKGREGAAAKLAQAQEMLLAAKLKLASADAAFAQWEVFSGAFAGLIAILLIVDAFSVPRLRRRCLALEADLGPPAAYQPIERRAAPDARGGFATPVTRAIDAINGWTGNFVAYWSVIAVYVYYYEVVARYVFNSPTSWAHESMFLMFGMQYLLSGAFALREDSHVRVDVIYEMLGVRTRAVVDVVTSFFFFVFAITLLVTGAIFALDSIEVWEVSFTEWAIQYWPVKLTIAAGALLIALQGLAKLIREVRYLASVGT